jgi:hypothetical protein
MFVDAFVFWKDEWVPTTLGCWSLEVQVSKALVIKAEATKTLSRTH